MCLFCFCYVTKVLLNANKKLEYNIVHVSCVVVTHVYGVATTHNMASSGSANKTSLCVHRANIVLINNVDRCTATTPAAILYGTCVGRVLVDRAGFRVYGICRYV